MVFGLDFVPVVPAACF